MSDATRTTEPVAEAITVADLPTLPALVVGEVFHARHQGVQHSFTHRHYHWLIDLDAPPRLPAWTRPFASFRGEDHLAGEPGLGALKANVLRVLDRDGIATDDITTVVMLAHARVLGQVFNPMSVFWCFAADGSVRAMLVEVHNTYGGRHAYVVPGAQAARTYFAKDFYVSPFNDVEGRYRLRVQLTPRDIAVAITLFVGENKVVTASVQGSASPATAASLAAVIATHPFLPQRVSALIRIHGIWLWARRQPVRPRPSTGLESVR